MNTSAGCQSLSKAMPSALAHLSNRAQLDAITGLLNRIAAELRQNTTEYKGTESFVPNGISSIFTDKTLRLVEGTERADGQEQFGLA